MRHLQRLLIGLIVVFTLDVPANAGLVFDLRDGAGLAALQTSNAALYNDVRQGFTSAGILWSNQFTDDVTVNIQIDYRSLATNVLGQASSASFISSLSDFRTSLIADATTASDLQAIANVPPGPLQMRTNDRAGNVILDNNHSNNNNFLDLTRANAKAVGLVNAQSTDLDATIAFSSDFSFDFDRSDGILASAIDFIGVAAHEIGHAMGFISGVDLVDFFSGNGPGKDRDLNEAGEGIGDLENFAVFNSLDLFRYSADSLALGEGVLDTAYGGAPYFSLDGGTTNLGRYSTGAFNGNGAQASHWLDHQGLGLLDPTLSFGELGVISSLDVQSLDVIGWDFNAVAVPEPSSMLFTTILFAGLTIFRRYTAEAPLLLARRSRQKIT